MAKHHPKRQFLEDAGALHPHPGRVRAELFERHRFFDPLDKVQVKYEMLRAHTVEGRSGKKKRRRRRGGDAPANAPWMRAPSSAPAARHRAATNGCGTTC